MSKCEDQSWMKEALTLAKRGWGTTHPNPMVGCVIVKEGKVVAQGWHARAGEAHAEKMAIAEGSPGELNGATLYVTLEPCSTVGRTGACTESIIRAGINRVVIGTKDPNPKHNGKGVEILKEAGIEVSVGCCEELARDLNWIFNHHTLHQEPFVAGKVATTLDGKLATRGGYSQWITSESARMDVMQWRALFPAIAVGAGTVKNDNPSLTIRIPGREETAPVRLVLDRSGTLKEELLDFRLFTDRFQENTVWITSQSVKENLGKRHELFQGEIWGIPNRILSHQEALWEFVLGKVWEEKLYGIWVEGGRKVLSSLLSAKKLHALWHYRAPLFFADPEAPGWIEGAAPIRIQDGFRLTDVRKEEFGPDQLMRGLLQYPEQG